MVRRSGQYFDHTTSTIRRKTGAKSYPHRYRSPMEAIPDMFLTQGLASPRSNPHGNPETVGSQFLSLRHYLTRQQSPGPVEGAETPRNCGLFHTKLLTVDRRLRADSVSLCPVVSKAPDFAILVRNFKWLILLGYSVQKIRTFRIPLVSAKGAEIETRC